MTLDPTISLSLRLAITLLFAAAIAHKLRNPVEFKLTLDRYLQGFGVAGRGVDQPLFVIVVGCELAILGACVLPSARTTAALLAGGTLLIYACAMAANLWRGNQLLDCGCTWGSSKQPVSPVLIARNVLLALSAFALALPVRNREFTAIDIASVVVATLTAIALYDAGNRLLNLRSPAGSKAS